MAVSSRNWSVAKSGQVDITSGFGSCQALGPQLSVPRLQLLGDDLCCGLDRRLLLINCLLAFCRNAPERF